jgi:hypothetical protein
MFLFFYASLQKIKKPAQGLLSLGVKQDKAMLCLYPFHPDRLRANKAYGAASDCQRLG